MRKFSDAPVMEMEVKHSVNIRMLLAILGAIALIAAVSAVVFKFMMAKRRDGFFGDGCCYYDDEDDDEDDDCDDGESCDCGCEDDD